MTSNEHKELELVKQLKKGDSSAHKAVYSEYVEFLTATCARYIPTDEDVKDVLQESFIKIFTNIDSFEYREPGSLKAWMSRIVTNEALKFLKSQSRLAFTQYSDEVLDISEEEPDTHEIPAAVIQKAIRQLPDGYRTVFNLYVFENKSHKEIASLLNIKEKTSSSQFHRAKSLLAKQLKDYKSDEK